MTDAQVPAGYVDLGFDYGFLRVIGPLYGRRDAAGLSLGFRVEQRHCNAMGVAHGGMLATFMDMQVPLGTRVLDPRLFNTLMMTISLSCDFFAPAPLGAWISGETQLLKTTSKLVFAQGLMMADGAPIARASAVFRIGPTAEGTELDAARIFPNG